MQCQKCGQDIEPASRLDAASERAIFCPACSDRRFRTMWWVAIAIGIIMLGTMLAVPLTQM